jgi:hypothetical protein
MFLRTRAVLVSRCLLVILEPLRALHAHLQPKAISEYAPVLQQSAKQHILDIVESPERHQNHAKK